MLDTNMLGFKELYDVQLKATYRIEVANNIIDIGEPIAIFESVQFGNIDELKSHIDARGGYGNQVWVSWETTKEVHFNFSQGIFSRLHLAILGNSEMVNNDIIAAPITQDIVTDENSMGLLKYKPIEQSLFVYASDGTKVTNYTLNDNKIFFNNLPYENMKAIYDFEYTNGAQNIVIGRRLIDGYMELCGKTRLKDDKTGQTITGIIKIPRLKLMSDLSIRLGKDAPPVVGNFKTIGYPVGSKGQERVMDFILLNDDIDSDM